METFKDWLMKTSESSPITRLKWNAALGLMPPIAPASIHSGSTARPWQVDPLLKAAEKPKRKKKKKKKKKKLDEAKRIPHKDLRIGSFVDAVGKLKKEIDALKKDVGKKPKEKPKEEPKEQKPEPKDKPELKKKVDRKAPKEQEDDRKVFRIEPKGKKEPEAKNKADEKPERKIENPKEENPEGKPFSRFIKDREEQEEEG